MSRLCGCQCINLAAVCGSDVLPLFILPSYRVFNVQVSKKMSYKRTVFWARCVEHQRQMKRWDGKGFCQAFQYSLMRNSNDTTYRVVTGLHAVDARD